MEATHLCRMDAISAEDVHLLIEGAKANKNFHGKDHRNAMVVREKDRHREDKIKEAEELQ